MTDSNKNFEIVSGKNEHEEPIFSVLVKRSYSIKNGVLERKDTDNEFRKIDKYYDDGDPEWSTVQYEYDLAPYKPYIDVVVIANAYAGDAEAQSMSVSVKIGNREKKLTITGDRVCHYRKNASPIFSDPIPFKKMEIRYDNAYGGIDEESNPDIPFHYPRNFTGKGVALLNTKERVQNLPLPNIEDPNDLLLPERVIIGTPEKWHKQPIPQGLGWCQRSCYPRSALLGSYPLYTEVGVVTPEEKMGMLPKNHIALAKQFRLPSYDAYFNNGASVGMLFKKLKGNEKVSLTGLTPEGLLEFHLPNERPNIKLDIGLGEQQLKSKLHTVSIRPDDLEIDLIWQGSLVYEGYSWLPKMTRLHAEIT